MLTEDFEYAIKKFGRPTDGEPLSPEVAASYRGKLPDSLIDFWLECGLGLWLDGCFQFCHPTQMQSVVESIFDGDPDVEPAGSYAYGYSAFGHLHVWNNEQHHIDVNLPRLDLVCPFLTETEENRNTEIKLGPDRVIASQLWDVGNRVYLGYDENGDPLFDRALKTLGRLELGECYGFVPALALGGAPKLENLQRVRALEHFSILADLGRFRLLDYSTGRQRRVRTIGPQ